MTEITITRRGLIGGAASVGLASVGVGPRVARAAGADGELTWAVHVSLAPVWFDPADVSGIITPFMVLYALHDAVVKPMPGRPIAPSLAETWSGSEDGLVFDFVLREGATFHNGDPVTADDVKFSFERYRGTSYNLLKDRVAAVETPDPRHVRFRLKQPWPDFLTFYASVTAAGWGCAAQIRREGRRGRFQESADRCRALQIRLVQARRGTRAGGIRPVLAQGAEREAPRLQGDPRRGHAIGCAQARRG
jgi:peptide/nickel transport system substrate-binding protein